jgi:hypothetical protein
MIALGAPLGARKNPPMRSPAAAAYLLRTLAGCAAHAESCLPKKRGTRRSHTGGAGTEKGARLPAVSAVSTRSAGSPRTQTPPSCA